LLSFPQANSFRGKQAGFGTEVGHILGLLQGSPVGVVSVVLSHFGVPFSMLLRCLIMQVNAAVSPSAGGDKLETFGKKPVSSNVVQRNQCHQETPVQSTNG